VHGGFERFAAGRAAQGNACVALRGGNGKVCRPRNQFEMFLRRSTPNTNEIIIAAAPPRRTAKTGNVAREAAARRCVAADAFRAYRLADRLHGGGRVRAGNSGSANGEASDRCEYFVSVRRTSAAAAAGVSLLWLLYGDYIGYNVIRFWLPVGKRLASVCLCACVRVRACWLLQSVSASRNRTPHVTPT